MRPCGRTGGIGRARAAVERPSLTLSPRRPLRYPGELGQPLQRAVVARGTLRAELGGDVLPEYMHEAHALPMPRVQQPRGAREAERGECLLPAQVVDRVLEAPSQGSVSRAWGVLGAAHRIHPVRFDGEARLARDVVPLLGAGEREPSDDGGGVERAVVVDRTLRAAGVKDGEAVRGLVGRRGEEGWRGGVCGEVELGADGAEAFLVDPEFDACVPEPVQRFGQVVHFRGRPRMSRARARARARERTSACAASEQGTWMMVKSGWPRLR